jgi:HPt (histidine-containing phosphotransfer) domain-containing protein
MCVEAGMDAYITKPLMRKELLERVDQWITLKRPHANQLSIEKDLRPLPQKEEIKGQNPLNITQQAPPTGDLSFNDDTPMDFKLMMEEFQGDKESLLDILNDFLNDVKTQMGRIHQAISDGDADFIRKEAHAIKGGAANMNAIPLSNAAYQMEMMGKRGSLKNSLFVLETLENEVDRLETFVKNI